MMVEMFRYGILTVLGLESVPFRSFLSFLVINAGTSTLVSIKAFLSVTMIVGNIIDVYLFGFIAVVIN
jgi:hypothetical protein